MTFKYEVEHMEGRVLDEAVKRGHVIIDKDGKKMTTPKAEGYMECMNEIANLLGGELSFMALIQNRLLSLALKEKRG